MGQDGYLIPLPQIANIFSGCLHLFPCHIQYSVSVKSSMPALVSLWAKERPRCLLQCKSFRGCLVTSLLSQAFKREYITGKGKSAVSSAFHLCLNDKMREELSSIWAVLVVAGLSAVLQAEKFSSGVSEEKRICHNSLGLLCAGRGFWVETLGWWGVSGGCNLSWHPNIPVKTTDKRKSQHCIETCLDGAQRVLLEGASLRHEHHNSYCLSSEQSMIYTPKPSCANVLHAFRSWRIYSTRFWDNMTNLHLQLDLTNSANSPSM